MRQLLISAAFFSAFTWVGSSRANEPKLVTQWKAPHPGFFSVTFSNDGLWLATSGTGRDYAVLWDAKTWKEVARFAHGLNYPLTSVAFSPDNKILATVGGHDQTVKLWDIEKKKEVCSWNLGREKDIPWKIQFAPDGKWLAVCHDRGTVQLWNPSDGKKLREWNAHTKMKDMDISPDGKLLVTAGLDGLLRLWNPETGERIAETTIQNNMLFHVAFSADGKRVAGSEDRNSFGLSKIVSWEVPDLKASESLISFLGMRVGHLVFSKDGRWMACEPDGKFAVLLDLKTKTRIQLPSLVQPDRLNFTPDSRFLVIGTRDGTISVWDLLPIEKK